MEFDGAAVAHGFDRNDVPDIFGHHVSHHEIDIVQGIDTAICSGGLDRITGIIGPADFTCTRSNPRP
jgi:hypothetical protein